MESEKTVLIERKWYNNINMCVKCTYNALQIFLTSKDSYRKQKQQKIAFFYKQDRLRQDTSEGWFWLETFWLTELPQRNISFWGCAPTELKHLNIVIMWFVGLCRRVDWSGPCFFTCYFNKPVRFEPVHDISNNVVCATSKASDQPAHMRSLIRAFASSLSILWLLSCWLNTIWGF